MRPTAVGSVILRFQLLNCDTSQCGQLENTRILCCQGFLSPIATMHGTFNHLTTFEALYSTELRLKLIMHVQMHEYWKLLWNALHH